MKKASNVLFSVFFLKKDAVDVGNIQERHLMKENK